MKDKKQEIFNSGGSIVNTFKDEYDNEYIIFTHHLIAGYLVASSQFGWEWLKLSKDGRKLVKEIPLTVSVENTISLALEGRNDK